MSNYIDIFPTRVHKFKISNNKEFQERYLDRIISSYENKEFDVPKGWVTKQISTSYSSKNSIIEGTPQEYTDAIDSLMGFPWSGKVFCWHNVVKDGEYQETHHHSPALLSGIHFLKFDKEAHEPPVFYDPAKLAKAVHSQSFKYDETFTPDVEEGDLIIFPSYLEHHVPRGTYKDYRVTISFNFILDQCLK